MPSRYEIINLDRYGSIPHVALDTTHDRGVIVDREAFRDCPVAGRQPVEVFRGSIGECTAQLKEIAGGGSLERSTERKPTMTYPLTCATCGEKIRRVVEPHDIYYEAEDGDSLSYVPSLHDHKPAPAAPAGWDRAETGPEQAKNLYLTGGKLVYRYAGKLEGRDVWSSTEAPGLFVMDDGVVTPSPRATEIAARGESNKSWT